MNPLDDKNLPPGDDDDGLWASKKEPVKDPHRLEETVSWAAEYPEILSGELSTLTPQLEKKLSESSLVGAERKIKVSYQQ